MTGRIGDNWVGGVAPTPRSNLIFPNAPVRTESINNFNPYTPFHSITIAGSGYDIYGNGISLIGGIDSTFGAGTSSFALDFEMLETQAIDVAAGGTLDLVGSISEFYKALIKDGSGTLILSGNTDNTFTTAIQVNAGTLLLNKAGAIAVSSGIVVGNGTSGVVVRLLSGDQIEGTVEVNEGSTFDLNGFSDLIGDLDLTEGTVLIPAGSTLTVGGDISSYESVNNVISLIAGPGTLDLNGDNSVYIYPEADPELDVELRISAVIANGGIYIHDDGVVALAGANTYAGFTEIGDGGILVEHEQALGTTDGATEVDRGSSLYFAGNLSIAETIRIKGDGLNHTGSLFVKSGTTTLTGVVEVDYDSQIGAANGSTLDITGEVFGFSDYTLTAHSDPTGRVILASDNTYGGDTLVNGGFLRATHSNAFGKSDRSANVGVGPGGTLEFAGGIVVPATRALFLDEVEEDGTSKLINVSGDNRFDGSVVFLNRFQSIDVAASTSLTLHGGIFGTVGLEKSGPGTLVLSGNSTFTGLTNVDAGTMLVNGNIATSAGVTVNTDGILGGTGFVPAVSVGSSAGIVPGLEGPGVLSAQGLDMAMESYYAVDLEGIEAGEDYDQLDVTGTVVLRSPSLSLAIDDFLATTGQQFTIINNDGSDAVDGTFANLPEGAIVVVDGQPFSISYAGGTNNNDVVLTSVAIQLTPSTLVTPTAASVYSQQLTATGGSGSGYVFSATGLPAGLAISPSGLVTGTPTTANDTQVEVSVTVVDDLGATSNTTYLVSVNPAIAVSPSVLPTPILGSPYSQQLTATGGSGSGYVFSATGLPAGLAISSNGLISGIATSTTPAVVLVTVTDGDGASTLATYDVTAAIASTTTGLAISPATSLYGQAVSITATVASAATAIAAPTGTVRFFDGETLIGTASVSELGTATLVISTQGAGSHSITAVYPGDANYEASVSDAVSQAVGRAFSSSSLATSTSTPNLDQPVTFTVTVAAQFGGAVSGTVSFFDGSTLLGTAETNEQGVATFVTSGLRTGEHTITAVYNGGANLAGSTAPGVAVTISQAPTETVSVTTSAPQVFFGQGVTLTANFSATSNNGAPMTGTVRFFDGDTLLGVADLVATPTGSVAAASVGRSRGFVRILVDTASGRAQLATTALSVGDHVIRAVYSGDASYSSVTSETPGLGEGGLAPPRTPR